MTGRRAGFWVLLLAVAAYATALGNGFAYDDQLIVQNNPVVTEGQWSEIMQGAYWQIGDGEGTLFRPVTTAAFAIQWKLWGGAALGFHAVNVAVHALVSLGVLALLWIVLPPIGALAGGVFFAIHPVHVEVVANMVGLGELLAALMVVAACLLYIQGAEWSPAWRGARVAGLVSLYLLGLGAKEIAVTLPGLLLLFEFFRPGSRSDLGRRLRREAPVYLAMGAALLAYLAWRGSVLSSLAGDRPAPVFFDVTTGERILSAISVWPEYVRLLLAPLALSVDYGPPVLVIARGVTPEVIAGGLVLVAVVAVLGLAVRRNPPMALGVAWIGVALLPVSNLFFPVGVLLAERILYLPSIGAALAVGAGAGWILAHPRARVRKAALVALPIFAVLLVGRTVTRNPVWLDTFSVIQSLNEDHPESFYAHWKRAEGLARVGQTEEARANYEVAVALSPGHYGLLCAAADYIYKSGDSSRSEALLRQAMGVLPDEANAYQLLGGQLLERGQGRQAHRVVLTGLARYGSDHQLWAFLAESYVAKGDLEAAVRALRAAMAAQPGVEEDRARLDELMEAMS